MSSVSNNRRVSEHVEARDEPRVNRDDEVTEIARSKISDLARGLAKSPTLRTLAVTALVGAIATGVLFLVVASPPLWMIGAVVSSSVGVGLLLGLGVQLPFKGKQKLEFEASALGRLKGKNYNQIIRLPNENKIFLGALPNRLKSEGEHLAKNEGVGAVLSLNEPWEMKPVGLSLPYQESDWEVLGVTFHGLDVLDHTLLSNESLDEAAVIIHNEVVAGKNVYVHCRAGVGRSAMAVAAYLIKYQGYTVEKARETIKLNRTKSTINRKVEALRRYASSLPDGERRLIESASEIHGKFPDLLKLELRDAIAYLAKEPFDSAAIMAYAFINKEQDFDYAKMWLDRVRPNSGVEKYAQIIPSWNNRTPEQLLSKMNELLIQKGNTPVEELDNESSIAIAAYLIFAENYNVDRAIAKLNEMRPDSGIERYRKQLNAFAEYVSPVE